MSSLLILIVGCAAMAVGLLQLSRSRDRKGAEGKKAARSQRREALVRALTNATGGRSLLRVVGDGDGTCALGVDDFGQLHALEAGEGGTGRLRTIPSASIVGVGVDEHIWTVHDKGGTQVRVGAIDLKVFVADLDRPTLVVSLLDDDVAWNGKDHRAARDAAHAWEGTLRLLARGDVQAPEAPAPSARSERDRAKELAQRYLEGKGRPVDEMAQRQVRSREGEPVR